MPFCLGALMSGFKPLKGKSAPQITQKAGHSFASKLEAAVFELLWLRERAGEIRNLKCQVYVYLSNARIACIPDFQFEYVASGEVAYAEAKGFETDIWRLKKRLWKAYGPGPLEIWKGSHRKPKLIETVYPVAEQQLKLGSGHEV